MVGLKKYVFGTKVVVNLNAKKGYRVSPGANPRAIAVGQCAKGKSLEQRKQCFASGSRRHKKE